MAMLVTTPGTIGECKLTSLSRTSAAKNALIDTNAAVMHGKK
jgi:hypothetical protein